MGDRRWLLVFPAVALLIALYTVLAPGWSSSASWTFVGVVTVLTVTSLAYLGSRVDPAALFVGGLVLTVFNQHWVEFGAPGRFAPERVFVLAGMATLLLRSRALGPARAVKVRPLHVFLLLAAAYAVCSALWAGSLASGEGLAPLLDRLGIVPFAAFVLAPALFGTPRARAVLLTGLVGLGAYLGLTTFFQMVGPHALVMPSYILDSAVGIHAGRGRGPFADAAANGFALFACAVASTIAMSTWRRPAARAFAAGVVALCALGLLFTLQRSIWIGATAATVITLLCARDLRRFLLPTVVVAGATVVLVLALLPGFADLASRRENSQATVWDRQNLNRAAIAMVDAHPLVGVGWAQFRAVSTDYLTQADTYPLNVGPNVPAHNLYLSNMAELGLVGATLWGLALLVAVGGAILRRGPPELRPWRLGLVAVTVMWLALAAFTPLLDMFSNLLIWTWAGLLWAGTDARRAHLQAVVSLPGNIAAPVTSSPHVTAPPPSTSSPASSSELPVAFECPSCGQRLLLARRAASLVCARCGWLAAGSDGVLDFVSDPERAHERAYYEAEYGRSGPPAGALRPLASTAAPWHDPIRPVNRLLWSLIGDVRGQTLLLIGNGGSAKELHLLSKEPDVLVFSDLASAGVSRVAAEYDLGADRDRIVFAAIDALDLPLADDSIDLVYGNAIMHHLPDVDRCLAEIARVLRPGGRALFMDDAYSPAWQRAKTTVLRPLMRHSHRLHERSPEDVRETLAGGFREADLARRIRAVGCEPRFYRQGLVYYLWHRMSLVLFTRRFPQIATNRRIAGALIALDEWIGRFAVVRRNQIRLVWEVRKRP